MRQTSIFSERYMFKVFLSFFFVFILLAFINAPKASADFRGDMQSGYAGMPRELPDDASTYPGDARWSNIPFNQQRGRVGQSVTDGASHQYITVGGGSVDDAGGNNSGNYFRTATFVVYTTNPGKKRLTFTFVDRRVNIDGDTSTCDGRLMITPISQVTGSGQGEELPRQNTGCGSPNYFGGGVDDRGLVASDFAEVTPVNSAGTPHGTGVYKAYVHVRLISGSGNQASFHIKTDSDARIGYSTEEFNTYGTRLINGHTVSAKVRPPCNAREAKNFTYSDADERYPNIQPESAGGDLIYLRENNQVASEGFIDLNVRTLGYVTSGSSDVPDFYEMRFRRIQGGNGITMGLPWESGNYYFRTCPPPPNNPAIEVNSNCTQVRVRPGYLASDASRYQIIAADREISRSESNSFPRSPYWAGTANGAIPPNTMLGANTANNGGPQWWGFDGTINGVNRYKSGQEVVFYYIGYKDSNGRTIDAGGFSPPARVTLSPEDVARCYPPNWWLQPYTNGSANYVELNRSVNFEHILGNAGPDVADGYSGGMESNYDIDNPAAGIGDWRYNGFLVRPANPGNTQAYNSPTYAGSGAEWLGRNYCQRYFVDQRQMVNGAFTGGRAESSACAVVVGGKTSIGGRVESEAEPEQRVTFEIDLGTNHYTGGGGWGGYTAGCTYTSAFVGNGNCSRAVGANGTLTPTIPYTIPGNIAIGTDICVTATLTIANEAFYADPARRTVEMCVKVVARPYFKVFGGDISAGNGFAGNCIQNASVIGWNTNDGASGYRGSGVQYAIYAHGVIKGVAPGRGLPDTADFGGGDPKKLAFANTGNLAAGEFGGNFRSGGCSSDYWGGKPHNVDIPDWRDIGESNKDSYGFDRNFEANSAVVLRGSSENSANFFARNNNTKLYVDGDVYINSNITAENGAESIDQIPNFMLIARGNIYIGANVSSLFGTYVAQPTSGGSKGQIYTCARMNSSTSFEPISNNQLYDNCRNQLKVTGSFVANKIHLQRTLGSLYRDKGGNAVSGSGYDNAGEIFQYNPLTWLRQSTSKDTSIGQDTYDAMTILPPVL